MNRNEFLKSSSICAFGSFVGKSLFDAEICDGKESPLPIIDTHQHLWDANRFKEGWSIAPVPGNFGMQEYVAATRGLNVIKTVYMEVAVPAGKRHEEALYAIELCGDKSNRMEAAVIAVDPSRNDFVEYMSEFENSPCIKGIRYFFKHQDEILSKKVIENMRALGEMGMHFEFSVPINWLPDMTELVGLCSDTQFFVQHCGNADPKAFFRPEDLRGKPDHDSGQWIRDMKEIATRSNVVCKISGLVTRAIDYPLTSVNLAPAVNHCIEIFGSDRVMFASDWPVCLKSMEMLKWVNILKEIVLDRSFEDQMKLFSENAAKYYDI